MPDKEGCPIDGTRSYTARESEQKHPASHTGAADLNAQCAAIVPLMAGLDAFAAVSGRSAVLKDSLEMFLNASVKAVAA